MRIWEVVCGSLAVTIAATVAILTFRGGFIEPTFVLRGLVGLGLVLGIIAIGLVADIITSSLVAKVILAIGAVGLFAAALLSFDVFLVLSAWLAIAAAALAFARYLQSRRRAIPPAATR
ncbi:MAG: hypothetical protein KGO05_02070 [Chloroflexota bacterium]|nr:hypothetical protein [Chloroflexota bacterium]